MKQLLNEFPKLYQSHDEFKRRLEHYQRTIKSDDWQFVRDIILTIKGEIYEQLLSARYTQLPPAEKDIEQRTYYNIIQVLDFLSDPMKWIAKKRQLVDYVKPQQKRPTGSD